MSLRIEHRHVLARLATGPVYESDSDYWRVLTDQFDRIRAYFLEMGLEIVRDEPGGFAYLRQQPEDAEESWTEDALAPLPRILRRTPLSYHQTLFLVLLREELLRHEQSPTSEGPLYRDTGELTELLRPYFPESNNEKKLYDAVAAILRRFVTLNLLTPLRNRTEPIYRVEPILKARLPAELIADIRQKLCSPDAESDSDDDESPTEDAATTDPDTSGPA